MTAGQLLVSLSGLSGVSAGAHLMAITAGAGATIFAETMTVALSEPNWYVGMMEKGEKPVRAVTEVPAKRRKELKRLFVEIIPESLTITSRPNILTVVEVRA